MKYYKTTDNNGNEWATSRSNPDRVVNYFTLTTYHPYVSWTANESTSKWIVEVQTNIVEINAKEYRAIMKNRDNLFQQHLNAIDTWEETDFAEDEDSVISDTSWIEDLSEKQFTEEKITLRLTFEQLSKLTIQTDVTYGASKYDPIVSEGVMDMLREKRLETEAKMIAFREFCEVVSEKFGTDNVADAKELLKIHNNKEIFNKYVKIYKNQLS